MFKRVLYEDWQQIIPIIAFILTFAVFIVFVIRAIRMRKDDAGHMASLPLENDTNSHE